MNLRQQQFVREYLVDLNATQAAIRAGYSKKTAGQIGEKLLKKIEIREVIDSLNQKRQQKTGITAERVLDEIARMAFYDPAEVMIPLEGDIDGVEVYAENGKIYGLRGPTDIRRLPEDIRRAIVGWGWDRNQNFTVKLADKSKALDQLARHLALYNDKLDVNVTDGLAERIRRAKQRTTE